MTEPIIPPTGEPPVLDLTAAGPKPDAPKTETKKGDSDGGNAKGPKPDAPKSRSKKEDADDPPEPQEAGLALLYLGQKKEKVVDLECECGNTYTFTRESAKTPARAVIDCPDCYATLMNTAGPGVANIEDVIFVPPSQHKAFLAAKKAKADARDAALRDFKQPWQKDAQLLEARRKGEE